MEVKSNITKHIGQACKKFCNLRLRDCLPAFCILFLLLNIYGYLAGFVQFQLDRTPASYRDSQQTYSAVNVFTNYLSGFAGSSAPTTAYSRTSGPSLDGGTWEPSVPCAVTSRSGRPRDDGRWFNYGVTPFQFYAFSAVWDDRQSLELSRPVIRVIAVSSTRNHAKMNSNEAHYLDIEMSCRLHYENGHSIVISMEKNARPIGWGWWLNNELVREYIFTCPSYGVDAIQSDSEVPVAVSVLIGKPSWPYHSQETCMPIEFPEKPKDKRNLAACVQVSYNHLRALNLIEWFELQRLLGVEMIGIYNMSISDGPGAKVLKYYSEQVTDGLAEPFVDLRRSDYIKDGPKQYLLHGSPVINDCVYRHMHRFNHIAIIDFDEAIIPQGDKFNLIELVADIKNRFSRLPSPPAHYIFANNYYFFDLTPNLSTQRTVESIESFLGSELTVLKYNKKAPLSNYGYSVKSIIDPQACLQAHNHYCWAVTPQFAARGYITVIDASLGVNQHYKYCHLNRSECDLALRQSTVDNVMLKYRDKLIKNVAAKIRTIFGDSPTVIEQLL